MGVVRDICRGEKFFAPTGFFTHIYLDNSGGFVVYFVHKVVLSGVKWIKTKARRTFAFSR